MKQKKSLGEDLIKAEKLLKKNPVLRAMVKVFMYVHGEAEKLPQYQRIIKGTAINSHMACDMGDYMQFLRDNITDGLERLDFNVTRDDFFHLNHTFIPLDVELAMLKKSIKKKKS